MIDTPPPKELLFSGGAGALNYEMGFSQSLLEIIGRPKLSTYNLGGVSAGAACAAYMHCALNENDYDFKYWYQNSSRKFYEPANKKYFGFFTNSDLIYRLSKEFYIFCSDKGVPDFNSKYHCAMTILENFGVEKFIVDYFTSPDDFALAVKASCFIPGITSFGLYCTYRGKKALDGGIATPIPFKNENSEKVFINVLPDRWPFVRDRAENMKVLNIYESADLHFPMDYWLWKETWADEMFLKGYFAGFKIQKEVCEAFGVEMEARLEPEREDQVYESSSDFCVSYTNFLKNTLSFQEKVNQFWKIHLKNFETNISLDSFQKVLKLIFHFLFPYFRDSEIHGFIEEEIMLTFMHEMKGEISLDQYYEFFARFCTLYIENNSLEASLSLLDLIYERITKITYKNVKTGKVSNIDFHIEVSIFPKKEAEMLVLPSAQRKKMDIMHYQEKIVPNNYLKLQAENDYDLDVEVRFLTEVEIVPLGFSVESIILQIMNSDFKFDVRKNQKNQDIVFFDHFTTKKNKDFANIKLVAYMNESIINQMKIFLEYQAIFTSFCLKLENGNIHRMNQILNRKMILKNLKNKSGLTQFYNLSSSFFDFEDYEIDLIDKLQKEWGGRKQNMENLLPYPILEGDDEVFTFHKVHKLSMAFKFQFCDLGRSTLKEEKQNKQVEPEMKSLNFHSFLSKYGTLPEDPFDSFVNDIIEYSKQPPLQIMVVGPPKLGKSTFGSLLSVHLSLPLLSPSLLLDNLIKKLKNFQESPELDEEGNPKDPFSIVEKSILMILQEGGGRTQKKAKEQQGEVEGRVQKEEAMVDEEESIDPLLLLLLNDELKKNKVRNTGFILDLPMEGGFWIDQLERGGIELPEIGCRRFTNVIELDGRDDEVRDLAKGLREGGGKVTSEWDREEARRKKKKEEERGEAEDDDKKMEEWLIRPSDYPELLEPMLQEYRNIIYPRLKELFSHLTVSQYIKIEAAGIPPYSLVSLVTTRLSMDRPLITPLVPKKMEGGPEGNLKELLTREEEEEAKPEEEEGRREEEEEEGPLTEEAIIKKKLEGGKAYPARCWSAWGGVDPVELGKKGRIVVGKGEWVGEFGGRVFLFGSEENRNEFLRDGKRFLEKKPKMPKGYNVGIVGMSCTGKKTYANLLSEIYGWKVVDVEKIVGDAMEEQKNWSSYTPCNPSLDSIHCNEAEWKEISKGNNLPAKSVIPLLLHKNGFKLMKRPPRPVQKEGEEGEEGKEEEVKEEIPKKKEKGKGKKEEDKVEVNPADLPPEDIPLKDLSAAPDEFGDPIPFNGYIFINFPTNEEQIAALKDHNIIIDKIIFLNDTNEEETEPGKIVSQRTNFENKTTLESEIAFSDAALKSLIEAYSEEVVKTVSIIGSIEEVFLRIRTIIDPFYVHVDDESQIRLPSDLAEGDEPIPYSSYGPFCPITLHDEKWLVPGREDQELQVKGNRYRFYSEKENKIFRSNVEKYAHEEPIKELPGPRIMIVGARGSGVKTQLKFLNEKYKIPILELKDLLLGLLKKEKMKRKKQRFLNRGFKVPELNEEGAVIEDQELLEESSDFDRKKHEIDVLRFLLQDVNEVFINGNMFDIDEEQLSTPFLDLLTESKRIPEVIIFLKIDEKNLLSRLYNPEEIKKDYDSQIEKLKIKRATEREEAKRQALLEKMAARQEAGAGEEEDANPEEGENIEEEPPYIVEEDPEAPKLEEMLNEKREKLLQRREADSSKLEELMEGFGNLGIKVVNIDGGSNRRKEAVFLNIQMELISWLERKEERLERFQIVSLPIEKIKNYERGLVNRESRFGKYHIGDVAGGRKEREVAALYRKRIYYFSDEEEKKKVTEEPLKLLKGMEMPLDINYAPGVFLIGKQKSGVSSLSKMVEKKMGLVRIKISKILDEAALNPYSKLRKDALELLKSGNSPSEEMCVELIARRLQLRDCQEKGWVLDNFPTTIRQAKLLAEKNIIPNCVFSFQLENTEIKKRALATLKEITSNLNAPPKELKEGEEGEEEEVDEKKKKSSAREYEEEYAKLKFGFDPIILHERLKRSNKEITDLENFYITTYNNLRILDGCLSKWGLYDRARNYIKKSVKQRQMLARSLVIHEPAIVGELSLTQNQIMRYLGEYQNYCPVSFKSKKQFTALDLRNKQLAFYNFKLYPFSSIKCFEEFKAQPYSYLSPLLLKNFTLKPNAATLNSDLKSKIITILEGYDAVELLEGRLEKGREDLIVKYKERNFGFRSVQNLLKFMSNPHLFEGVKLPVKNPVKNKEILENMTKMNAPEGSSSAYLENAVGNILMKAMAMLGYHKLKYPTITTQETALKFLALQMKANNPNKNELYRQKYKKKVSDFIDGCELTKTINEENKKREKGKLTGEWNEWEEENFLRLTEKFECFMKNLQSKDKTSYFYEYIR